MTNLNPASILIGRSGGFDLHNSFLSPGLQPPQLKLCREDGPAGQLSYRTMSWLPTHELPEEKWLSPSELLAPFRLYNMIEDQLKWFTGQFADTVIPRELLRDHLTQDICPQVLDQHSSYLGNRMAACQIAQQSLVFTCCGLAGHKMAMSVLDGHSAPMQCLQRLCIDTGKPIQQLAINSGSSSSSINMNSSGKRHSAQQFLLAARGPNHIAIMQASIASLGESIWSLQLMATVRSKQAVRHVAWSPYNPCQAAFICHDGSLHIFTLSQPPLAPAGSSVEVHTVVQGGHAALKTDPASRMGCEWTHPAKVACTAGRNLVQCHLLGLARDARVVLLHSRPEGDEFLGLARPSQGPGAKQSSYLAASTKQHVLLFDTRHFNAPVLCWAHTMDTEPPQLLAFALSSQTLCESGRAERGQAGASPWPHVSTSHVWQESMGWGSQAGPSSHHMASQADANYSTSLPWKGQSGSQRQSSQAWPDTQASQGPDPLGNPPGGQSKGIGHEAGQVTGAIVGSGLALGQCMAFRFMVKPSGQSVTAQPPEDITKKKTRRGPIKFRRRENWGLVEVDEAATSAEGGRGFAWRPGIADAVQTWNLARTICAPLKPMSDLTKAPPLIDLAAVHGEEAERMILQCADLQGMAILPATYQTQPSNEEEGGQQKPDQQQQPDMQRADLDHQSQKKADVKGAGAPEQAVPKGAPVLNNIDIRQLVPKAEVKSRRQADPRWKSNKFEVMFDQKGLFQTDVSRGEAADEADGGGLEAGGLEVRLPELQAATAVDEVEARMRWEAANAAGRNATFDAAVPGPRFKAPNTAAAVARALPIVTAAHKSLQGGEASSSACDQAATFLTFASFAAGPAIQAACQGSGDPDQPGMVFSGDKLVPLASWKGASLGPEVRPSQHSSAHGSQLPDSQASVHILQPSQGLNTNPDKHTIPLVPADRAVGGGQLACPVIPAHSWSGALLMPPAQQPSLSLNTYYAGVGPGQECDDIAELEALWLSSQGQQRASQSSPGLQATTSADRHQTPVVQVKCKEVKVKT
ncbi:hypothetical protein WJX82_009971 [Trebouxia sp. C0006]